MVAETHTLIMPGPMLKRGFWLYVWRAATPQGEYLYVGRTGDNSSPNAVPPYQRMGQHLGHHKTQNALRKHLERQGIVPEECSSFQLVAYGPIFPEADNMTTHLGPRDIVAAMEKALVDALSDSGYNVLNTVKCRKCLDLELWNLVHQAFAQYFPMLMESGCHHQQTAIPL